MKTFQKKGPDYESESFSENESDYEYSSSDELNVKPKSKLKKSKTRDFSKENKEKPSMGKKQFANEKSGKNKINTKTDKSNNKKQLSKTNSKNENSDSDYNEESIDIEFDSDDQDFDERQIKKRKLSINKSSNVDEEFSDVERDIRQALKEQAKKPLVESMLHKISWFRVILDEAHVIKDRSTSTAKAVFNLISLFKWCLTGNFIISILCL